MLIKVRRGHTKRDDEAGKKRLKTIKVSFVEQIKIDRQPKLFVKANFGWRSFSKIDNERRDWSMKEIERQDREEMAGGRERRRV